MIALLISCLIETCCVSHLLVEGIADNSNAHGGTSQQDGNTRTIADLPDEILSTIFHKIPFPQKNELRGVCRSWKTVMDELVGIRLRIGTSSEYDPIFETSRGDLINPTYHVPTVVSNIGISELFVGNIQESWQYSRNWMEWLRDFWRLPEANYGELPKFRSPTLVTNLNIYGKIPPSQFDNLILQLPCIRMLSLSLYSLQHLSHHQLQNLPIPQLEALQIREGLKGNRMKHQIIDEQWDCQLILTNLLKLLENRFPKLEYAVLDLIYGVQEGLTVTMTQLDFLRNHSRTLKSYSVDFRISMNNGFNLLTAPTTHPDLTPIVNSLHRTLQLQGLRVLPTAFPKLPFSTVWTDLASKQGCLTDLAIAGVCYEMDLLQNIVDTNFNTLTSLFLWELKFFDDRTLRVLQLDCDMFWKCENLQKLAIRGWTVTLNIANLSNVSELPKKLIHIDFRDLAIPTSEITVLALELPQLETLELHYVGNKREMGMDIVTLRRVVQHRRLKKLRILRSLNGKFPSDGIPNGNPENEEILKEQTNGLISLELKGNYYSNSETTE